MSAVKTSIEKGIAELTLDHPPVNALDSGDWNSLAEVVRSLGLDEAVRVIVIRAQGRGFCAGVDIKELAKDSSLITKVNRGCYDTFAAIHDCPVPVIAAAHGFVLGGGIGIVGSCDIIVASVLAYLNAINKIFAWRGKSQPKGPARPAL